MNDEGNLELKIENLPLGRAKKLKDVVLKSVVFCEPVLDLSIDT